MLVNSFLGLWLTCRWGGSHADRGVRYDLEKSSSRTQSVGEGSDPSADRPASLTHMTDDKEGAAGMKSQQAQLHGSIESAEALIKNLTRATPREGDTEKLKEAKDCDSLLQSLVGTYAIVVVLSNPMALTGDKQGDDLRTMLASVLLSLSVRRIRN